jgi:hypothetical protein
MKPYAETSANRGLIVIDLTASEDLSASNETTSAGRSFQEERFGTD